MKVANTSPCLLSKVSLAIPKSEELFGLVLKGSPNLFVYAGSVFGLKNYVDYKLKTPKK